MVTDKNRYRLRDRIKAYLSGKTDLDFDIKLTSDQSYFELEVLESGNDLDTDNLIYILYTRFEDIQEIYVENDLLLIYTVPQPKYGLTINDQIKQWFKRYQPRFKRLQGLGEELVWKIPQKDTKFFKGVKSFLEDHGFTYFDNSHGKHYFRLGPIAGEFDHWFDKLNLSPGDQVSIYPESLPDWYKKISSNNLYTIVDYPKKTAPHGTWMVSIENGLEIPLEEVECQTTKKHQYSER